MAKIIIYTDGGSRGNPGKAGIGVVYCVPLEASAKEGDENLKIVKKFGAYLGDGLTNNEAEYRAVLNAFKNFETVLKIAPATANVEVRSDSQLLVNQMSGRFKINNENIRNFVISIKKLTEPFAGVEYVAIPREKNKEADKLVNEALDKEMGL